MATIKINKDRCNSCGICVNICPMELFYIDSHLRVSDEKKCIVCRACQIQCPKEALLITD